MQISFWGRDLGTQMAVFFVAPLSVATNHEKGKNDVILKILLGSVLLILFPILAFMKDFTWICIAR